MEKAAKPRRMGGPEMRPLNKGKTTLIKVSVQDDGVDAKVESIVWARVNSAIWTRVRSCNLIFLDDRFCRELRK